MTEGQRLLAALGVSLGDIARELSTSKPTVSRWKSGERVPAPDMRRALEAKFRIPVAAWSKPAGSPSPPPPDTPASPPAAQPSLGADEVDDGPPEDRLDHLREVLRTTRLARKASNVTATELAKLSSAEGQLIERIARLERERREEAALLEARIVREHPAFLRALDAIEAALKPYPEAARAVAMKLLEAS